MDVLGVITENMVLSFGDMPSGSIERYRLYYYAGALYNMTARWLEDGARETPEQMAREFLACCSAAPLVRKGSAAATG